MQDVFTLQIPSSTSCIRFQQSFRGECVCVCVCVCACVRACACACA